MHPLGPFSPVTVDVATSGAAEDGLISTEIPLPAASELAQTVPAQTYAWGQDDGYLAKELWSFDEFVRKNAWRWIDHGAGPQRSKDYEEVDGVR